MENGLLRRGNWFILILSQRCGRQEMILWSMRLRLVNEPAKGWGSGLKEG
jgi:hypothetical protein